MKDEKIENLEGNLSKVIDMAALYVGGIAVALVIIGWIFKKSIDEKLTLIEEKETSIKRIELTINSKVKEMIGYYQKMKDFADDVDKTNEKLNDNQIQLKRTNDYVLELNDYICTIEDIVNSSVLVNKFLDNKIKSITIVSHVEELFKRSTEPPLAEVLTVSELLCMGSDIDSLKKLEKYFRDCLSSLKKQEINLWEKYFKTDLVSDENKSHDEDTMTLYDEINSNYTNWEDIFADITFIEDFLIRKSIFQMNNNR